MLRQSQQAIFIDFLTEIQDEAKKTIHMYIKMIDMFSHLHQPKMPISLFRKPQMIFCIVIQTI